MARLSRQALTVLCIALAYWHVVNFASGTQEPWDGRYYWVLFYPAALAISAALGFVFRHRAWLTGGLMVVAQIPVMLVNTGAGSLLVVGLALACLLAIPAILAAWLGAKLRNRSGPA